MGQRTDICNIALVMLGEDQITSIDEDSGKAQALKVNYAIARDATLEAHEWSFAIRQFKPDLLADPPLWQYDLQYQIPADILRVLAVELPTFGKSAQLPYTGYTDERRVRNQVDHEVQGRLILCDRRDIYCTGIARVEEEGIFSNLFIHAFAAKLAVLCCYAITESNSKFDRAVGLYGGFIQEAKSRDGMQSSTRRLRQKRYARVR